MDTVVEAWLERIEPGKERSTLELSRAVSPTQSGDDEKALAWMSRAIDQMPGKELELLDEVSKQLVHGSPAAIKAFTRLLPADVELRAEHFKNQASNISYNGFAGLADLAQAIPAPAEQAKLTTGALQKYTGFTEGSSSGLRMNATDFQLLSRRLHEFGRSGGNAAEVEAALAKAKAALPKPRP